MVGYEDITKILNYLKPYVQIIVLFLVPYYFIIGNWFASLALPLIELFPVQNATMGYIVAGIIGVIGLVLGLVVKEKKPKEE